MAFLFVSPLQVFPTDQLDEDSNSFSDELPGTSRLILFTTSFRLCNLYADKFHSTGTDKFSSPVSY